MSYISTSTTEAETKSSVKHIIIPHSSWTTTFVWWKRFLTRPIRNHIIRRFFFTPPRLVVRGPQKWSFPINDEDLNRFMLGEREVDKCTSRLWKHDTGYDIPVIGPPPALSGEGMNTRRSIMYFYGGGFQSPISKFHWGFIGYLSRELDAEVAVIPYPLCPANNAHTILPDLIKIYTSFVSQAEGRELIIMGDSAGGQITLALTFAISAQSLQMPSQIIDICSGTSLTPNPAMQSIAPNDLILSPDYVQRALKLWAGIPPSCLSDPIPQEMLNNPILNPMAADLSILPKANTKLTIVTATWDVSHADMILFIEKAKAAGVNLTVIEGEHQFHCFPIAIDVAPECEEGAKLLVKCMIENGE